MAWLPVLGDVGAEPADPPQTRHHARASVGGELATSSRKIGREAIAAEGRFQRPIPRHLGAAKEVGVRGRGSRWGLATPPAWGWGMQFYAEHSR
jgi:hypothetical protein